MRGAVIWRALYALLLWISLPWVLVRLWLRGRREPLYRSAIGERFGFYGRIGPRVRPLIWVHAVSLGETRAAQPLLERLMRDHPDCDFLVTQMTSTGRGAAEELFAGRAQVVWLPYDYGFAVRRFLKAYRPTLGILMETEVWFNLVRSCRAFGIPLLLVNARLSERSLRGYRLVGQLARDAFGSFSAIAAQTSSDANRLCDVGARSVEVTGNMKYDMHAAAALDERSRQFRQAYGHRRVFLAASTRDGEEALILDALHAHPLPGVLSVIVPRHPQRFSEVDELMRSRGLRFVRRSAGNDTPADCDYILGDSIGEMPAYYGAADVAFVGGSLLPYGGQNLIEACAAGVPVLLGPSTYNFSEAADIALSEGAALRVKDADALVLNAGVLCADDSRAKSMGQAGKAFCARHRGATDKVCAIVERLLKSGPDTRA